MQNTIKDLLQFHLPLSIKMYLLILKNVCIKKFKKGEHFLQINEVCDKIFYLHAGFLRGYVLGPNNVKITCWFKYEKEFVTSVKSYSLGVPSNIAIEFIEDTTIFYLQKDFIENCIQKDIHISNFYRKAIEKNFNRIEKMLISQITKNATERYLELMQEAPKILQRAPLAYIASYLGITQSSLSRLRTNYQK